jgi:hypothetical protein
MIRFALAAWLAWLAMQGPADASPGRSHAARAEFKRLNPCPANGAARGPCPGWEIDHVQPLKCGGPDTVSNMQWLTVADHKAKTKSEAKLCRKRAAA